MLSAYLKKKIDNLPQSLGDIIWDYYYKGEVGNQIQKTHKDCILELKNIQESVKNNIKFKNISRNKSYVIDCINKKKNHNGSGITNIFHKNYKIYFKNPDKIEYRMPLDIFIDNLNHKNIIYIGEYCYRIQFQPVYLHYWKRNLKRMFIIKLMFYNYIRIFWNDTYTNHYYIKNGKQCLAYIYKNCKSYKKIKNIK